MRIIGKSVTIILRKPQKFPTEVILNLMRTAPLYGISKPIAGHNKNEFP